MPLNEALEGARDQFSVRYYDWCVSQANAAAQEGFRRVRAIRGYYAMIFSDYVDEFGVDESLRLCHAQIKKTNRRALELRGEVLSPSEIATIKRYHEFRVPNVRGLTIMRPPKGERNKQTIADGESAVLPDLDLADVENAFLRLGQHAGEKLKRWERGWVGFRQDIEGWIVLTAVEIRHGNLRYTHDIVGSAKSAPNDGFIGSASYLVWLGLGDTKWEKVTREDLAPIAASMCDFAEIFFSAAPHLLKGIPNPWGLQ